MCQFCGYTVCPPTCPTAVVPTPCNPCTQDTGCLVKLPSECVTINNGTLKDFLNCTNLLNYLYACIVNDPVQYAKWCLLWAACSNSQVCGAPTNLSVGSVSNTGGILTWSMIPGVVYDVYIDNVLVQASASTPYTISGLTASTSHTVKIVSKCTNGGTNFSTVDFTTTAAANLIFSWDKTAGESVNLSSAIDGTFDSIDWGDGTVNTSLLHTYSVAGNYTVRVVNSNATTLILGNKIGVSIYKITAVTALPSTAVTINLSANTISSLPSLAPLTGLITLNIYRNALTSINVSSNTLLQTLGIADNSIAGVVDLTNNTVLEWFEADRNSITNVTGFASCPNILLFQVSNNLIPVATVNAALVHLDTAGLSGGIFLSNAQTPVAAPTGAGATAKTSLLGKAWTATTD